MVSGNYGPVDLSMVGLYCCSPVRVMGNDDKLYIYDDARDIGMLILCEPFDGGAWRFEVCTPHGWKPDTVDDGMLTQSGIIAMMARHKYPDAVVYERNQKIDSLLT